MVQNPRQNRRSVCGAVRIGTFTGQLWSPLGCRINPLFLIVDFVDTENGICRIANVPHLPCENVPAIAQLFNGTRLIGLVWHCIDNHLVRLDNPVAGLSGTGPVLPVDTHQAFAHAQGPQARLLLLCPKLWRHNGRQVCVSIVLDVNLWRFIICDVQLLINQAVGVPA